MVSDEPVSLAVAGLGGYAGSMIEHVLDNAAKVLPRVRLAAVCDPHPEKHPELADRLRRQGVAIHGDYDAMLDQAGLEAVWLPVPIDLHVPFAVQALERGLGVLLEKPIAGTVDEIDRLIAARDASGRPVLVGFQDIYDSVTQPLKRSILDGEIGDIRHATVNACWPRASAYFQRAGWAGALRHRGSWVLDSPVNNALAHFINVPLFLMGQTLETSAVPQRIEAELYRAAAIENYDTASVRVTLDGGATLLVLFSHACARTVQPRVEIVGSRGVARWDVEKVGVERDGRSVVTTRDQLMRRDMLQTFAREVRGLPHPERLSATLEVGRAHGVLVNGASQASPITAVPESAVDVVEMEGSQVRAIRDIESVFERCAARGQMLHESGQLGFTRPAGSLSLEGYRHFAGPCGELATQAQ